MRMPSAGLGTEYAYKGLILPSLFWNYETYSDSRSKL